MERLNLCEDVIVVRRRDLDLRNERNPSTSAPRVLHGDAPMSEPQRGRVHLRHPLAAHHARSAWFIHGVV